MSCANSRLSPRSTRSPGPNRCATCSWTPTPRSTKRARRAKRRSRPKPWRPSSNHIGKRFGSASPSIANCPNSSKKPARADGQTTRRPKSPRKAENVQNRNATVPRRLRRSLHQQFGRARSEDDESENENLRLVPNPRRRIRQPYDFATGHARLTAPSTRKTLLGKRPRAQPTDRPRREERMTDGEEIREIVRSTYEARSRGDLIGTMASFADDVVYEFYGQGTGLPGMAAEARGKP